MGSLFVLEPWFGAGTFHFLKVPTNMFSFQETTDWAWPCLVCTSRENQHRAISYKNGRNATEKTPEIKGLEAYCLRCTFTSVYRPHSQCFFAQERHPCLFPTYNSPIIMANTPKPCLFLSELWYVAGSFHWLKCIPKVFSVEEEFDVAWKVLLNIWEYQHTASSFNQDKIDISQTSQSRIWKLHGSKRYFSQC